MKPLSRKDLLRLKKNGEQQLFPKTMRITVGCATCGCARGAENVYSAFKRVLRRRGQEAVLERVGCSGWCSKEPIVTVQRPGMPKLTLGEVAPGDVPALIKAIDAGQLPAGMILYRTDAEDNIIDGSTRKYGPGKQPQMAAIPVGAALPFLKKQKRIVLRNCGIIDPLNLAQYCGRGGFSAACTALTLMTPEQVIGQVQRSGLRGRGGAGFPTGAKWRSAREAPGKKKYIVCNADEGDPGAYMDRSVLEGDPFSVLEGMLIGAYAIGASEGFVYVREEYPLAVAKVTAAIGLLKQQGLLGKNILGSGFDFTVRVAKGAGAFVCGEETAMLASLEGRAGEPMPRPPYPVEQGLQGRPTCINNVETLATIPVIIARGGSWFSRIGTKGSTGTKIFSLVGAVQRVGLVEVPMGISLKDIVYEIGGGVGEGHKLKAVQTGGPSGGCIPARRINISVDYESLARAGSIMGSGGMIVLDETTCMVDVAKYFMGFLRDESCGKCLPCREGTAAAHAILENITGGTGTMDDLVRLRDICRAMAEASLCGLGRTAANPVLSTLAWFKSEYDAHIRKHTCQAGVCTALIRLSIDKTKCIGCGACMKACPAGAVIGKPKKPHSIIRKKCIACRACAEACPVVAVVIQ